MPSPLPRMENYQDIGRFLRDCRESLNVSVPDVARRTNIRAKYLTSIEAGLFNELPGAAYTRGYLQNYAEFLGVDREALVDNFEKLDTVKQPRALSLPEPTRIENKPGLQVIVISVSLVVALLLSWLFWFHEEPPSMEPVAGLPEELSLLLKKRDPSLVTPLSCSMQRGEQVYPFCDEAIVHVEDLMPLERLNPVLFNAYAE